MQEQQLEINGVVYDCRELTFGEMLPYLEREGIRISIEIMRVAVSVKGKPLGDAVEELGFSVARKLLAVINKLNGLSDDEEDGGEKKP